MRDDAHVLTRLENHRTVLRRTATTFVATAALAALSVLTFSGVANADPGIGWGAPGPGILPGPASEPLTGAARSRPLASSRGANTVSRHGVQCVDQQEESAVVVFEWVGAHHFS